MKGYIFEYYKYVRYPKDSIQDIRDCFNKEANESILTFGEYDRLKINNVEEFHRYRDLSSLAKDWIGNRQSILLYDLVENPQFIYEEEKNKKIFKDVKTKESDKHLFWALTELPFCSELREKMQSYDKLLQSAQEILNEIIQKELVSAGKDCRYMVLGSLGTFGICILWFSNQYADVLRTVNKIKCESKYKQQRMYLAAHTMFSRNPYYDNNKDKGKEDKKRSEELIQQIQGSALVQVTLKKWINKKLIQDIKFKNIKHTSGEFDMVMEVDAKEAFICFEKWNIFNHDTDEYQNNILQTRVIFAEVVDNNDILESIPENNTKKALEENMNKVKVVYERLRELIWKKVDKTAGIIDTLDSLHCDYRYNVASAVNQSWAEDFSYIFLKNMECLEQIINLEPEDCMFILRMVLNNLKQQIFHIAEANSLNFELPKCHLRYTGQEDCILFAYMGIIKEILKVAYQLESYNKQSEIVPIVTVDAVPIIESELYFDKSFYVKGNQKDQEFKILSLNLPHVTFYEVPIYFQYLYHEIYHYIVPKNREERDYVIGIFLSTIYFHDALYEIFFDIFEDENVARRVIYYVQPLLYDIVIKNYSVIHTEITEFTSNGFRNTCETDTVLLIDKIYQDRLIKHLVGKNTYIQKWVDELFQALQDSTFKEIGFENLQEHLGDEKNAKELINKLKKELEEIIAENKMPKSILLSRQNRIDVLNKIMDGIEEVSADIPMIELSDMSLKEYMLLYSYCLNNEMIEPDKVNLSENLKEMIRVGIILDFYDKKGSNLKDVRDDFIYSYMARYINLADKDIDKIKIKLDNRKTEAMKWFDFFERCYKDYKEQFKLFQKHCRILLEKCSVHKRLKNYDIKEKSDFYFTQYRNAYKNFSESIRKIEEIILENKKNDVDSIYEKAREELYKSIFTENIKLIHYFQKQEQLVDIKKINDTHNIEKNNEHLIYQIPNFDKVFAENIIVQEKRKNISEYSVAYGLDSFLSVIDSVTLKLQSSCRRIFGRKNCPLWYRGQKNSVHGLLPGIMRKNNTNRLEFNYVSEYQRYLFEEFKYRADGAPEVMDRSYYSICDYLALMQHYEVATNFLDFSEDAFTGLYFALDEFINHEKDKAETNAALFIFSPHLYNEARRYMITEAANATCCTEPSFIASQKTADYGDGMIPNVATKYNEQVYDMFLTGNLLYESSANNRYGYEKKMTLGGKEEMAYLPLAVYTSRLNPRVRSQSGIFVAYNLYTEPSKSMDAYAYMGLEKVQEYYFNQCNRENKEQFLYKIVLEKDAVKEIAECLVRMGISKERIYPELANIGLRVK